jgi:hypothetical protein
MADVKEVEAAVRKDDPPARRPLGQDGIDQFVAFENCSPTIHPILH